MEGSTQSRLTRIVKLQYKDYETGEYSGAQPRTTEDTLQLIAAYPWAEQRDHLAIGLTNPSVTIEGPDNDYLKLSPWYNGKFVLHYFDKEHHLYTHPLDQPTDAAPFILAFFSDTSFDCSSFKKEITWLQDNNSQFRTQSFHYTIRLRTVIGQCLLGLYVLILSSGFFILSHFSIFFIILPLAMLIWLAGFGALILNHYRAAKDKVLILSKGKQEFSFGPPTALATFNKKDIREIITYGRRSKGSYISLTRVEIDFSYGRTLDISCLIIPQEQLIAKFPNCPKSEVPTTFPFINPASAALFG
jgi:hypothetical protein